MKNKKQNFFVRLYSNKIFLISLLIFYTILISIFIYLLISGYIDLLEINNKIDEIRLKERSVNKFLEIGVGGFYAVILEIVLYIILFLFLITTLRLYFITKKYKKINTLKNKDLNKKEL